MTTLTVETPAEVEEAHREAVERRLTGSVTLHYTEGRLTKIEERRFRKVGEVRG